MAIYKQIKELPIEVTLLDTHALSTEDTALATPVTKKFSLLALKNYILNEISTAWVDIGGKPFTTLDSNTMDTIVDNGVISLKVKDNIYASVSDLAIHTDNNIKHTTADEKSLWDTVSNKANTSDLTNKLTQADIVQGNNIILTKSNTTNEIIISSSGAIVDIVRLLGAYNTLTDLQTAHPNGSEILGGYLVGTTTKEYYYWSFITNAWVSAGNIQGIDGKSAYQSASSGGFTGTENEFNTQLASIGNINAALALIVGDGT